MGATFREHGYEIVRASDTTPLLDLRDRAHDAAVQAGATAAEKPGYLEPSYPDRTARPAWFDNFHTQEISGPELNRLRMGVQKALQPDIGQWLFDAFPEIGELVGADVMQQKGANLVIAQPGDSEVSPTHRDAPLNSNFEVVCWCPLNDCYGTKSMTMLDFQQSEQALDLLRFESFEAYSAYATEVGEQLEVKFGEACLFWPGLVHALPVNQTHETRWSVNHRFKSFWAPYGAKGSGYFKPMKLSPLTEMGVKEA